MSLVVSRNAENRHAFTCTGPGAGRVDVQFSGTAFDDQDIINRGIMVSPRRVNSTIISTITIPATVENNETSIKFHFV